MFKLKNKCTPLSYLKKNQYAGLLFSPLLASSGIIVVSIPEYPYNQKKRSLSCCVFNCNFFPPFPLFLSFNRVAISNPILLRLSLSYSGTVLTMIIFSLSFVVFSRAHSLRLSLRCLMFVAKPLMPLCLYRPSCFH